MLQGQCIPNGKCEAPETAATCPADCGVPKIEDIEASAGRATVTVPDPELGAVRETIPPAAREAVLPPAPAIPEASVEYRYHPPMATVPTLTAPCSTPESGLWVSSGSGSAAGNGTFTQPFLTLQAAMNAIRTSPKVICVQTGSYDLGSGTLEIGPNQSFYGNIKKNPDGTLSRGRVPETTISNDGSKPVVKFLSNADIGSILDGFKITHIPGPARATYLPLVLVKGGSPQIRNKI